MTKELTYKMRHTVTSKIKINQAVIEQVTDEWRSMFYDLKTPDEIIEHVAYNLLQGRRLSTLDGFANLPNSYAVLVEEPVYECEEIKRV